METAIIGDFQGLNSQEFVMADHRPTITNLTLSSLFRASLFYQLLIDTWSNCRLDNFGLFFVFLFFSHNMKSENRYTSMEYQGAPHCHKEIGSFFLLCHLVRFVSWFQDAFWVSNHHIYTSQKIGSQLMQKIYISKPS